MCLSHRRVFWIEARFFGFYSRHRRVLLKEADPLSCIHVIVGYLGKKPDLLVCVKVIVAYFGKKPDSLCCVLVIVGYFAKKLILWVVFTSS